MFDEPTANLDVKARLSFKNLLDNFTQNKTLVFISHRIDEIANLLDRCVYMDLGKIIKEENLRSKSE